VDSGEFRRVWLFLVLGLCFLFGLFFVGPGPHDAARSIGFVLALTGFAGVVLARYTLGRSFSVIAKATDLVTTGVYSKIRNPIYVFSWFLIIGVVTIMRMPLLYLIPVVLIPIQSLRARAEARVLEEKFGDSYRRYRDSTWF
jgi:protein-S-isoprenylcysteine O-methyltransferase Ste14